MLNNASPDGQNDKAAGDVGDNVPASSVTAQNRGSQDGSVSDESVGPNTSLGEDISALVDDSKAYMQAELAFQKSRASFAGQEAKAGTVFLFGALAFLHLGLIGAVVGLIAALAPIVGAFAATGIVVGILLVGSILLGWLAARRFGRISGAFKDSQSADGEGDAL